MAAIVQAQQPQPKPRKWPPGHKYGGPCMCDCKIKYVQPGRPVSFKPMTVFRKPDCKISDGTTYKMSYYGFDPSVVRHCRGTPKIAKQNLTSAGDFSSDTTHKMSYGAWPTFKPQEAIKPMDHNLLGTGPMAQLTTNKHDYTAKPLQEVERVVHPGNLGFSVEPMEDKTTNNMSYQFPDLNRFEPATSFKPHQSFVPPRNKMDDKTTHKLSYQPFCPPSKEIFPWTLKDQYKPPVVPFEGCTIYNGSYFAPGQFVEDCVGPEGCYCKYPGECWDASGKPPRAHEFDTCPVGYNPSRDPARPPPMTEARGNNYSGGRTGKPGERDLNRECYDPNSDPSHSPNIKGAPGYDPNCGSPSPSICICSDGGVVDSRERTFNSTGCC